MIPSSNDLMFRFVVLIPEILPFKLLQSWQNAHIYLLFSRKSQLRTEGNAFFALVFGTSRLFLFGIVICRFVVGCGSTFKFLPLY
jgi:hypothetical protein